MSSIDDDAAVLRHHRDADLGRRARDGALGVGVKIDGAERG